jgi:hypothetical protein
MGNGFRSIINLFEWIKTKKFEEKFMELIFEKSAIGVAESAITPDGTKITFVHRTKSRVIVYYGKELIAECGNRQAALEVVTEYMREEDK